ncbi:MAG TPA: nucleoside-triphosphatase [Limnochorda sp.]
MPGSILVVTGPKESGKSTLCRELARAAVQAGVDVAGIVTTKAGPRGRCRAGTEAPPAWGVPSGERLVVTDLRSGRQALLGVWTGCRWVMREEGFALGHAALAAAVPCDLLIIDEIGRMELCHGQGWIESFNLLARGVFRQAVVTVREGCMDAFGRALAAALPAGAPAPVLDIHTLTGPWLAAARQAHLQRLVERVAHAGVVGL